MPRVEQITAVDGRESAPDSQGTQSDARRALLDLDVIALRADTSIAASAFRSPSRGRCERLDGVFHRRDGELCAAEVLLLVVVRAPLAGLLVDDERLLRAATEDEIGPWRSTSARLRS